MKMIVNKEKRVLECVKVSKAASHSCSGSATLIVF